MHRTYSFRTLLLCGVMLFTCAFSSGAVAAPASPRGPLSASSTEPAAGNGKVTMIIYDASGTVQAKSANIISCSFAVNEHLGYAKPKSKSSADTPPASRSRGTSFGLFSLSKKTDAASIALLSILSNGGAGCKIEFVFTGKQSETMRFILANPSVRQYNLKFGTGNTVERFDLEYNAVTAAAASGSVTLTPPKVQ